MQKKAIIIGAGPAGLTAAYELLKRTDVKPIVLEKDKQVGGISKTVNYKGNKMDFGPHRFFSKSDRVMNWWTNIMPLHTSNDKKLTISYQNKSRVIDTGEFLTTAEDETGNGLPPAKSMIVIQRLTRIYFLRQFFMYPIQLSIATLGQLGIWTTIKIIFSYLYARLFPKKPQNSLEDFMINKFGNVLYRIFFKDYTEKVWGIDCKNISADWGAQRVKGVSLSKAVLHAAKALTKGKRKGSQDINQKNTETSLIEQFLYPATGAGAMWEEVARQVEILGGNVVSNYEVTKIHTAGNKVTGITAYNSITGKHEMLEGDYFFSTMPIKELIAGMEGEIPAEVKDVAEGLIYRDFVYAGVLVKKMTIETPKDSWIYIQERDVKVARMQVYNNWGPYMVADPDTVWLGLEYFCTKGDPIWNMTDEEIKKLAIQELIQMNLITVEDVLDSTVNRMEKTYPAYFGTYDRFEVIQNYLNDFPNLFLVGRNGMHKYNNTDHSMLTAMVAVDNICEGVTSKANLWEINTEQEYHEEKSSQGGLDGTAPESIAIARESFKEYMFVKQKKLFWIFVVLSILQFAVFKWFYPFANFMFDSFVYLDTAVRNYDINIWPIGYAKFLRLINIFSHSDLVLVSIQYLILQSSLLYFYFTVLFLLKPGKPIQWLMLLFFCVNPALLSISNYVLSDAIFTGFSLVWFTQLIWVLYKPNRTLIITHGILLFVLFTIRYNALYYPIITIAVFLCARYDWRVKIASLGLAGLFIAMFVNSTMTSYKTITGEKTFSAFSGWIMANNAMIMYRTMDMSKESPAPEPFTRLHQMVTKHIDSISKLKVRPDSSVALYYMWVDGSPLKQYLFEKYKGDTITPYFKMWASVSGLYADYAKYLITKHPIDYAKNFLWQNLKWYGSPPPEFLGTYNLKSDSVDRQIQQWFHFKSPVLKSGNKEIRPVFAYPMIMAGINSFFLFMLIGTGLFPVFKRCNRVENRIICLALLTWFVSFGFSLIAAPIVLRYQLFSMVLLLSFGAILFERIYQAANEVSVEEKKSKEDNKMPTAA
ncbi:NAD(P)/FAD-dependent oxidoreductase [Paraflavitalea sp. CAU 1676]|uniref:NAD(P)/FAD-dependent oxidoreductase n=1 Tax=Paraflavitalea sp. CAU 1676 TaxID=3032598 RepID=UPI0023DA288C|nr:NAD(P)/FAD-dependent oxidoreductase [Paraflavitalea sp. CAU 1676]MDF2190530.1 NAD(P)/FAD-dependent oxidoreductase [Paraflavitalea sp. CAU 1676]